ncbi:endolytic transglycosylase MltG [Acidithiobacillus sp.]
MRRRHAFRAILLLALLLLPPGYYAWCMYWPQTLPAAGVTLPLRLGSSTVQAIADLEHSGLLPHPQVFKLAVLLAGKPSLQAGLYQFHGPVSQAEVLRRLIRGQSTPLFLRVIPGWRLQDVYAEMAKDAPYLDLHGLPPAALAAKQLPALGVGSVSAEGWLYPDSYRYVPGESALSVLHRAAARMQRQLARLWTDRAPGLPLQNPYQALILASLVEKEGASAGQQARIAAVFLNRLRLGMPLQSDPTVIYAMGDRYQGALTAADMRFPSPYNTYLHKGLPPAPIAMPGYSSLAAVLHPARSDNLYFIAKGGQYFYSQHYIAHLRQIRRYLQGKAGASHAATP